MGDRVSLSTAATWVSRVEEWGRGVGRRGGGGIQVTHPEVRE